jgi:hypothetical protein
MEYPNLLGLTGVVPFVGGSEDLLGFRIDDDGRYGLWIQRRPLRQGICSRSRRLHLPRLRRLQATSIILLGRD